MRWIACVAAVFVGAAPAAAEAAWMHQVIEDAFQGDGQLAMTMAPPAYALGFRCRSAEDLALVFMTPESATVEIVAGIALSVPKLLVIVDSAPRVSMPAIGELTNGDDKLLFYSEDQAVAGLLSAALAAKKRVAVAVEIGGKIVHSIVFNTSGLTRALVKLVAGCNLKDVVVAK